ncbi:MAG: 50S ribosomal protein L21, partial [Acidimicrobiia bacterium]|nr:50S ribosomal protein L21 [Acidimicrobiia bacterium]
MYAIVKAGARQERVTVGEVLDIDRVEAAVGATVSLPLLLVVEGGKIS